MKLATVSPTDPRQIAARVRARIKELGTSESALDAGRGKSRTVLSSTLNKLAKGQGGSIRLDTLATIALLIGKTQTWVLTGEEEDGVRLSMLPGWPEVAVEAAARYKLSPEVVEAVGRTRVPVPPRVFDAAYVGAIGRAVSDAM